MCRVTAAVKLMSIRLINLTKLPQGLGDRCHSLSQSDCDCQADMACHGMCRIWVRPMLYC